MVVALGPGKFYGSSLPRPRIYTNVKLNKERVDPPLPVLEPFLSWANEAHWSMGGLSFKRHRLQGRIEGSIKKLRAQEENRIKSNKGNLFPPSPSPFPPPHTNGSEREKEAEEEVEEEDEEEEEHGKEEMSVAPSSRKGSLINNKRARKLIDEFERIAPSRPKRSKEPARALEAVVEAVGKKRRLVKRSDAGSKRDVVSSNEGNETVASGTRRSPRLEKKESPKGKARSKRVLLLS